ncbi:MAG: FAD:protein FMN transferase [Ignavibacteriaceae bacterium]
MKNTIVYIFITTGFFLVGYFLTADRVNEEVTFTRSSFLLGTLVEITVTASDETLAETAIRNAFDEINRVDSLLSTYIPESPVSQFNASTDSVLQINTEIFNLMKICDSVNNISRGKFDASLENLIRVWGFDSDTPHLPEAEEIKSALSQCGWKNIRLFGENTVFRSNFVRLNFGGIGKGYAVDKAMEVLKKMDINSAILNAGGDVKVFGSVMIIGIRNPYESGAIINSIKLDALSVATSGNYENYFERGGIRYHHLFDPSTGYPARELSSVSVIHKSNTFADALSTAVFVMGKEDGLKLINRLADTEAMIIDTTGEVFYSDGFADYIYKVK